MQRGPAFQHEELVIVLSMAIRPSSQTRARGDKEHRVADKDKGDEVTGETTSALTRADFLNELEAVPTVGPDSGAPVVEGLPLGTALLVEKRGPITPDRASCWIGLSRRRADIPAVMSFSTTSR